MKLKLKLKTTDEIHRALESGQRVYWSNQSYEVKKTPVRKDFLDHDLNHHTLNLSDRTMLDCRCISNYFGGLLGEREVNKCFVIKDEV